MLMAGLDGIRNRIDPGDPLDKNLYDLDPEERSGIATLSASLKEAVDSLESDHDFLTEGGVFAKDAIEGYIELRREEIQRLEYSPHPAEFRHVLHGLEGSSLERRGSQRPIARGAPPGRA